MRNSQARLTAAAQSSFKSVKSVIMLVPDEDQKSSAKGVVVCVSSGRSNTTNTFIVGMQHKTRKSLDTATAET